MAATERNSRNYVVLARRTNTPEGASPTFIALGTFTGYDAKAAIEAALMDGGLPNPNGATVCVGIPASNWNDYVVEPDPRPQFKVTQREAAAPVEPDAEA